MFGPRRRYGRRGGGGGGFGLFLLGLQLVNLFNFISRGNEFFPVTLGVLAVNIAAYLRPGIGGISWPSISKACISVKGVWFHREWQRMLFSPFVHASDFHLYYNMASFMWKAISLERCFGSGYFLYMVSVFSAATGALYLAINYLLAELTDQWSYMNSCAVGFSGVIFALKVVTTHMQPSGLTMIMGVIPVPMKLACWVELILISVLFPNVSFVGHLAGILVGLAFVSGPLKMIMDIPLTIANTGDGYRRDPSYTYQASATGHRPTERVQPVQSRARAQRSPQQERVYTSYTYSSGTTGYSDRRAPNNDTNFDEEAELQEAIQRSLSDNRTTTPTPSAPPPSHDHDHDHDEDVQRAVEQSLTDLQQHANTNPPPPYNPAYNPQEVGTSQRTTTVSDIFEAETVIVGDSEQNEGAELRRRGGTGTSRPSTSGFTSVATRETRERQQSRTRTDNMDSVRAARLRRFGGIT